MLAGAEGEGEGEEKPERMEESCAGFLRLPRIPTASAVGLPQPFSLSFQLAVAGLCLPWG